MEEPAGPSKANLGKEQPAGERIKRKKRNEDILQYMFRDLPNKTQFVNQLQAFFNLQRKRNRADHVRSSMCRHVKHRCSRSEGRKKSAEQGDKEASGGRRGWFSGGDDSKSTQRSRSRSSHSGETDACGRKKKRRRRRRSSCRRRRRRRRRRSCHCRRRRRSRGRRRRRRRSGRRRRRRRC